MAVQMFTLVRPAVFQEYDDSLSVVEVEEDVSLRHDQIQSLTEEFSQCIHTLFPGGDVEILDVQIDNGQLTVTVGSTVLFTPEQIEDIESEFDAWFVEEARSCSGGSAPRTRQSLRLSAEPWLFYLIPHQRWIVLSYPPIN